MERNQLLAIVVIVVVVAGAGVAFVFMQQPGRPPENTLIWETIGNPDYMDPHVNYESFGSWVQFNIYETLYTYPWDSAVTDPSVPLLAASAPVLSADGKNYTITLRQGITFHDGTPFNASCVKWNMERAMKIFYPDGPVWMVAEPLVGGGAVEAAAFGDGPTSAAFKAAFDNWVENSSAIIVMDTYVIRFRLADPYPAFIAAITYEVGAMISPTYAIAHASDAAWATWDAYGVDYGEYENPMTTQTCGTGPYMLTNWVPDQYIELTLYEDYWRTSTSTGAGSLEKVFIRTNEDVNGRSLNLRAGTTDACYWPTTNALDIWSNVTDDSTDPNIFVSTGGYSYTVTFFGFNMGIINMTTGAVLDEKVSPFQWLNFRRAASWAMDYEAFLSAAVNGFGVQGKGCIPIGMFGHNGSAYNWEYNLTAAVEEWNLAMADPNFVDSLNELDNHLVLYYNSGNTVREQGCLLLADGLNAMWGDDDADDTGLDAAMTVTTQALEWSNYLDAIREKRMAIFFVGWAPDYADPDNYVYPFAYHYGTYAQRISYNDTDVNTWYEEAKIETDETARKHLYNLIQEKLAEDAPYLWMYQATEFRTWRAWLHGDGLVYNPMHQAYFYHMYKTYPTT
ncbi:MAG: ABC transporter substrate-binding protein [Candidatus Thorarchaeota archaeon]|nr:ABC transporter substrate-binding protein [Candidatus Thorarchaeota archaeon]